MKTHTTPTLYIRSHAAPFLLATAVSLGLAGCGGGGNGAIVAPVLSAAAGSAVLVATATEAAGANCVAGGVRIKSGLDTNGNGVLEDSEVKDAVFACNGVPGLPGTSGTPGMAGTPGEVIASLVRTGSEPVGTHCAAAGVRIQSGLDANKNGTLEATEVKDTVFACNGTSSPASVASLLRSSTEPAGANCAAGGVRIQSGQDANGNGTLEDSEVRLTNYACNGAAGANGATGATGTAGTTGTTGATGAPGTSSTVPGPTGPAGPLGASGLNSLISTAAEGAGANCAAGGVRIQVGLDQNADGVLALNEVQSTSYVCGAAAGPVLPVAKTWRTTELIETNNAGDANSPQVAIDASGNALAVWAQSDGTRLNVWANRYTAATSSWGTAALIESDDLGGVANPQIAMDTSGNALAVWEQSDGSRFNIWANRFTAANNSWGTAVLIENNDAGNASAPQIAVDANGDALVVWAQSDGTRFNIYSNRFTASSSSWAAPVVIEADNVADAYSPQIAIDANGNAMAVWQQFEAGTFNIWANRYTSATGKWGTAALIETSNAGNASNQKIAVDTAGNALAVWTQFDGTTNHIYANRFTAASSSWGVAAVIRTGTGDTDRPQIAFDASGNALAVWDQHDGTRRNIHANRYIAATGSWGVPTVIESNAGGASRAQISVDASGNALAVWTQLDGTRNNIFGNRFTSGTNSWGTAALVETGSVREGLSAEVAVNAAGNGVAVWTQFDGLRYNIVASSFR